MLKTVPPEGQRCNRIHCIDIEKEKIKCKRDLKDKKETAEGWKHDSNNPPCSFDQSNAPVQDQ
jgi:hypothetical protein